MALPLKAWSAQKLFEHQDLELPMIWMFNGLEDGDGLLQPLPLLVRAPARVLVLRHVTERRRPRAFGTPSALRSTPCDISAAWSAGKHLLQIVNGILDFSKMEAARVELKLEVVRVAALVHEAVETTAERAGAAGVALDVIASAESEALWADPLRIEQVLIDLIGSRRPNESLPLARPGQLSAAPALSGAPPAQAASRAAEEFSA